MLAFINVSMQNVKYDYYTNGQYLVSVVQIGNTPHEIPFATEMQGEYAENRFPSFRKLILFIVINVKFTL